MGDTLIIANFTKREHLHGIHSDKPREWMWNRLDHAVLTWYMYKNQRDHISFISEYGDEKMFWLVWHEFKDVTEDTIQAMVKDEMLVYDELGSLAFGHYS